ncbi:RNA ligase family protein [Serratia nevei]|uniref:RNA ligase family protein n=1 Tax=Serratia nevei TaxID=2703794 RepID=A0ABT7GMD1_9GAMM|nr:RNA ligase family protein [Serratia nevei]MDK5174286.1 RNA ligase family protein [Serratia nevei]MDK5302633.1 RNA ligase family protein [Serratia nevei]
MFKFPSTPHLLGSDFIDIRKDKIMPPAEVKDMLSKEIIVEEKIDGANLGISFNSYGDLILQNRGKIITSPLTGQWIGVHKWINEKIESFFDTLSDHYIIFGEWCFATHSIYYDSLPDWFLGFDVFDKKENVFIDINRRNEIFKKCNITPVPLVSIGQFTISEIYEMITISAFSTNKSEGVYLKQENDRQVIKRAKIVRDDFIQNIDEHWSKKTLNSCAE